MAFNIINGKRYIGGRNITVTGDKIVIDGKVVSGYENEKNITIVIESELVENVKLDAGTITVNGNVAKATTGSGNIKVKGDLVGDIKVGSGDIAVDGNISGNVQTGSGDVNVRGDIYGDVETRSGDIDAKRHVIG